MECCILKVTLNAPIIYRNKLLSFTGRNNVLAFHDLMLSVTIFKHKNNFITIRMSLLVSYIMFKAFFELNFRFYFFTCT